VISDFLCILVIVEGKAPVLRERVISYLGRYLNLCRCNEGKCSGGYSYNSCSSYSLEEVTTSAYSVLYTTTN